MDAEERPLDGGNLGSAIRVGATVRRETGPWTPAVHALLRHLEARGLRGCPRVAGIDELGREILSYLPGETVGSSRPWPAWTRDTSLLVQVGEWLRDFHDAVADFAQPDETRWRLTDARPGPGEIICHNDVAPYNIAHGPEGLAGVFDWDVASPGRPALDLAFSAWQFVPLFADGHCRALGWRELPDRASRLRTLVDAYALQERSRFVALIDTRMQSSIDRIEGGARAGDPAFRRLVDDGHLEPVRDARKQLSRDADQLQRAIE